MKCVYIPDSILQSAAEIINGDASDIHVDISCEQCSDITGETAAEICRIAAALRLLSSDYVAGIAALRALITEHKKRTEK